MIRQRVASLVQPDMCLVSRGIVQSYKAPDMMLPDGSIETGTTIAQHRSCGRKRGHAGEHGPWGRWYRWRTIVANRLDP